MSSNQPKEYTTQEARKELSTIISKAAFANQPAIITKNGKKAAVIVSLSDFNHFRQLEDQADGELATKRLAEGNRRYSLEEVSTELGID